jgi:hypothetical protein
MWAVCQSRVDDAQRVIAECKADLDSLSFNNGLVKKLRAIRPVIANKLWNTVLASVSVMFSQMRREESWVTKEKDGFKVNGQSVESLSGSTLDLLGTQYTNKSPADVPSSVRLVGVGRTHARL